MGKALEGNVAEDGPREDLHRHLIWPCVGLDICASLIIMLVPVVPGMAAWERSAFQGVSVVALIVVNICLGMSVRP